MQRCACGHELMAHLCFLACPVDTHRIPSGNAQVDLFKVGKIKPCVDHQHSLKYTSSGDQKKGRIVT